MHPTNGETWKESYTLIETYVFDKIYMFSAGSRCTVLRDSTHAVQINCTLLSKRHYQCASNKNPRQL